MNNKQGSAQGSEFTPGSRSLSLNSDLQAAAESPADFIANFLGDPLHGQRLELKKKQGENVVNLPATVEEEQDTRSGLVAWGPV